MVQSSFADPTLRCLRPVSCSHGHAYPTLLLEYGTQLLALASFYVEESYRTSGRISADVSTFAFVAAGAVIFTLQGQVPNQPLTDMLQRHAGVLLDASAVNGFPFLNKSMVAGSVGLTLGSFMHQDNGRMRFMPGDAMASLQRAAVRVLYVSARVARKAKETFFKDAWTLVMEHNNPFELGVPYVEMLAALLLMEISNSSLQYDIGLIIQKKIRGAGKTTVSWWGLPAS